MRTILACVVLAAAVPALAADETIDIKASAAKYKVVTDGKGHYIAGIPFEIGDGSDNGFLFYGDGRASTPSGAPAAARTAPRASTPCSGSRA